MSENNSGEMNFRKVPVDQNKRGLKRKLSIIKQTGRYRVWSIV